MCQNQKQDSCLLLQCSYNDVGASASAMAVLTHFHALLCALCAQLLRVHLKFCPVTCSTLEGTADIELHSMLHSILQLVVDP